MKNLPLHVGDDMVAVLLVPASVQMLSHRAELDQKVAGQIRRLDLAPLFLPKAAQRRLVFAHNSPGIRAADKPAAVTCTTSRKRVQTILPMMPMVG